jgi:Ala-tRNA(Pro) deacylase
MSMAMRIRRYLDDADVRYETIAHPQTSTTSQTAHVAHVPGDCVAKGVLIHYEEGYAVAVAPSCCKVDLSALQSVLRRRLGLATEREIDRLFVDCIRGAVPPMGEPYGLATVVDTRLDGRETVWFEAGDHETLVKMPGRDFDRLMRDCRHAAFSMPV